MSETIYCQVGCTVRGQHLPTCPDQDACRGCIPRVANHGRLCAWCFQRLSADVASITDLVGHLRVLGTPHARAAAPSDGKAYRDPAEGSVLPAEWTTADELHAALASWALLILEEHPDGPAMTGPDERGATHTRYGTVIGLSDVSGTRRLVDWTLPVLEWCAGQEWVTEMRRELGSMVATTTARWPTTSMVERDRPVTMPCPRCEQMSLVYAPPSAFRQPFQVSCSNPDCARVWTEDEWEWLVNMVTKGERATA